MTLFSRRYALLGFGAMLLPRTAASQGLSLPGVEPVPGPAPSPGPTAPTTSYSWKAPPLGLGWTERWLAGTEIIPPDVACSISRVEGDWYDVVNNGGATKTYFMGIEVRSVNSDGVVRYNFDFDENLLKKLWPLVIGSTVTVKGIESSDYYKEKTQATLELTVIKVENSTIGAWMGTAAIIDEVSSGSKYRHFIDVNTGIRVKRQWVSSDGQSNSISVVNWRAP